MRKRTDIVLLDPRRVQVSLRARHVDADTVGVGAHPGGNTDLIFAVDSNPRDLRDHRGSVPVFTSNVFAILGLRSLYFALADIIDRFRFLKGSLAMVLAIVGLKMLLAEPLKAAFGPAFNIYLLLVARRPRLPCHGVRVDGAGDRRGGMVENATSQTEEPPAA